MPRFLFIILYFTLCSAIGGGVVFAANIEAVLDDAAGASAFSIQDSAAAEKARVNSLGNVGIGTTTPQDKLIVLGGNVGIGTWTASNSLIVRHGNVGIGTTTVPQSLYVAGTAEAQGFKLNQNAVAGYVLTSNSVGVGTWTPAGTLSSGSVNSGTINQVAKYAVTGPTVSGSSILFDDATNVGIGTSILGGRLVVHQGNVGIGTWLPYAGLSVATTAAASAYTNVSAQNDAYIQGNLEVDGTIYGAIPAGGGWTDGTNVVYTTVGADNVGIGTSTPQGGLVVTNGNVGLGTWAPVAPLHVNGQCVTGDTFIKTADGEKKIIDLKSGDYALSLDEQTGRIETRAIEALFDMGLQPVFELTTVGGRKIQTTGNHPYLVKEGGLSEDDRMNIARGRLQALKSQGVDLTELAEGKEFAGPVVIWKNPVSVNAATVANHSLLSKLTTYVKHIMDRLPLSSLESVAYASGTPLSASGWVKVLYLQPRDEVAVLEKGTLQWERIAGIEYLGKKEVYDIQVRGTHNFVVGHYMNKKTGKALSEAQEEAYAAWKDGRSINGAAGVYDNKETIMRKQQKLKSRQWQSLVVSFFGLIKNNDAQDKQKNTENNKTNSQQQRQFFEEVACKTNGQNRLAQVSDDLGDEFTGVLIDAIHEKSVTCGENVVNSQLFADFDLSEVEYAGLIAHNTYITGNVGIGTTTPQDKLIVLSGNVGIGTWTASNSLIVRQGNVGIGTTTVPQSLYVAGTAEAQGFKLNQNAVAGYVLTSNSVGVGTWTPAGTLASGSVASGTINQVAKYAVTGPTVSGSSILFDDATNVGVGTSTPQAQFVVSTGNVGIGTWTAADRLIVMGGNVGIGTTTVPQSLYVAGTAEAQAFKLNQNPVAGYVLTSSSVGVGTWMAASTLASGNVNSGTTNRLARYTGSTTLDSSTLNFDDGTNVGIGTINPRTSVEIGVQTMNINGSNVGIGTTTPQDKLIVLGGNVGIGTWTASNSLIVRQGNVGIGTTTVPQSLYVAGTAEAQAFKLNQNASAGYVLTSSSVGVGTWMPATTLASGSVNSGVSGYFTYYPATGTTVDDQTVLYTDGTNVGIGTTGPGQKLEIVGGSIQLDNNQPLRGRNTAGTSRNIVYGDNADNLIIGSDQSPSWSGGIFFLPGSATKMVIQTGGNVGIGTSAPQAAFVVTNGNVGIGTWTASNSLIVRQGNVGIGTTTVPQSLYVAGTAEAQAFKLNQNASAGYVLTSTSVGVGTWMPATTLASGSVNSGTINQVAKYAATGSVVSGSSILTDDGTNVGIGTITPNARLEAQTTSSGDQRLLNLVVPNTSGNNGSLAFQVNPNIDVARIRAPYTSSGHIEMAFDIYNNGISEAMRIKDGNVGIGTTLPGQLLEIVSATQAIQQISTYSNTAGAGSTLNLFHARGTTASPTATQANDAIGLINAVGWDTNSSGMQAIEIAADAEWGTAGDSTDDPTRIVFFTVADGTNTESERMRITSTGNVGIGTTTPQGAFVVTNGNVGIGTWTASNSLIVRQGNVGIGTTTVPQSLYVAGTAEAQAFKLNQNASAGYVLTSSSVGVGTWMPATTLASGSVNSGVSGYFTYYPTTGTTVDDQTVLYTDGTNVGIGTTLPAGKLHIDGGSGMNPTVVYIGSAGASDAQIVSPGILSIDIDNNNNETNQYFRITKDNAGTELLRVQENGNVGIGTTGPGDKLDVWDGGIRLSYTGLAHGVTTLGATTMSGVLQTLGGTNGGVLLRGVSGNAGYEGVHIQGTAVNSSPTAPAVLIQGQKANGIGVTSLADGEIVTQIKNSSTNLVTVLGSGNVGIGTTGPGAKLHVSSGTIVSGVAANAAGSFYAGSDSQSSINIDSIGDFSQLGLRRASGAQASRTIVANSESLGRVRFFGWDGVDGYPEFAAIHGEVDGTPGDNDAPGRLAFYTTLDGGQSGTERMRITNAGNVGVGTTSPGSNLSVLGGISAGSYATTAAPTGGMIISGNVGIGTTGPGTVNGTALTAGKVSHLSSSAVTSTGLLIAEGTARGTLALNDSGTTADNRLFMIWSDDGNLVFNSINDAESVKSTIATMTSTGNVGIGTLSPATAPTARLHVVQSAAADAFLVDDQDATDSTPFVIKSDGNVGIGTTNPLEKLRVNGDKVTIGSTPHTGGIGSDVDFIVGQTSGTTSYVTMEMHHNMPTDAGTIGRLLFANSDGTTRTYVASIDALASGTGRNSSHLIFQTKTAAGSIGERMRIQNDGNVGIGTTNPGAQLDLSTDTARKLTTTTWQTGSDARIKTQVQSIGDGLEIIRRLRPVKFHYTPDFLAAHPSVKDTTYYNFIAQEYQKVFPDSVTETGGLLYLNSSNMIPYAIAGIKEMDLKVREQQGQIQELEKENKQKDKEIKELKERVETLEKEIKR